MEEYLQTLVNFYPQSSKQDKVKELLLFVATKFKQHGLQVKALEYNGVYNLYASTRTPQKSKLLLQAHIDVVPAENQPFNLRGDRYYGRGTYDMLFATACYLQLCDDLGTQLKDLDLAFMLSGDEEVGGFHGVKTFLDDGYSADVCILPDAGNGFGSLNVAAKGIATHTIRIHGKSHHGSRPWEGDGAAAKLTHFLIDAQKIFDTTTQNNSTMTIAKISSGDADNQGPAYADATLDIRYKDKPDLQRIKQELTTLLSTYNGEITNIIEGDDYQLDLSSEYVKLFVQLYEQHNGGKIEFTKAHGSSDARFFAARNIPVIMLRPDGSGAHGDNEWVSKESIDKFYKLLKEYVLKVATIGDRNE